MRFPFVLRTSVDYSNIPFTTTSDSAQPQSLPELNRSSEGSGEFGQRQRSLQNLRDHVCRVGTVVRTLVSPHCDRIAGRPEPDTGGAYREYIEAEVAPGKTRFIARGGIETAINVGQRRYREILIELK